MKMKMKETIVRGREHVLLSDQESDTTLATRMKEKLLLGIGRTYTTEERALLRNYAKANGFTIPLDCRAGIYVKKEV